jgi:hypothetical protein
VREAGGTGKPVDPIQEATNSAPAGERIYLAAARPVLEAIVARNYGAFYQTLSSHARASSNPHQFVAPTEEHPRPAADLKNLTVEEFGEWMKKMEAARGVPVKLESVHVQSVDPKILAGQAEGLDRLEVMFAIGAMPADIPTNIRRASLRAQVRCQLSDEQVKTLAHLKQTTPEVIRQEDSEEDEEDRGTYLTVKFVLVEEGGELKVGYFEFMPPSMLD